ncbi:MAG: NeuD/PglB/VioB family sugar acetyltransferase [Tyzzerella sp.]|nr:NeuD/PglB/VioB family sugar acetyltransferase [Tyzzerella sp.]
MQDLILAGAGGCMRELIWQIQELNKVCPTWDITGFVDYKEPQEAVYVGNRYIPYLGADDVVINSSQKINVAICVGASDLRRKIADKYSKNPNVNFPNIILSETYVCEDVEMGQGCIISMDARVSTNVKLGDFVFLNTGALVCHEGNIGSYVTLAPDVKLAGNVTIGRNSEIGLGAKVIQGITIAENVVIGAGAVVVRDILNSCTAVGVPARAIK